MKIYDMSLFCLGLALSKSMTDVQNMVIKQDQILRLKTDLLVTKSI
jgi:hypothetical protein